MSLIVASSPAYLQPHHHTQTSLPSVPHGHATIAGFCTSVPFQRLSYNTHLSSLSFLSLSPTRRKPPASTALKFHLFKPMRTRPSHPYTTVQTLYPQYLAIHQDFEILLLSTGTFPVKALLYIALKYYGIYETIPLVNDRRRV